MASRPAKRSMADQERARPAGKSAPRESKWSVVRQKVPWLSKKTPGRRKSQHREEANGQLPGKKSYGRPRKRLAGRKVRTTSLKMVSRIPGSSEMESMLDNFAEVRYVIDCINTQAYIQENSMYIYEMKKERVRLVKKIETLKEKLKALPDQKIFIVRNGKYRKWFVANGKTPIYIKKKDRAYAEKLAQRRAAELYLQNAYQELNAMNQYLQQHEQRIALQQNWFDKNPEIQKLLETSETFIPDYNENEYLQKWIQTPFESNPQYPEKLIYKTLAGNFVRSKSEVMIANALYYHSIPYRYECAFRCDEMVFYPDFTICHPKTRQIFYWEHFGLMYNPYYINKTFEKLKIYAGCQLVPGQNLLTTYETKDYPLDCEKVEHMIEEIFC